MTEEYDKCLAMSNKVNKCYFFSVTYPLLADSDDAVWLLTVKFVVVSNGLF